MQIVYRNTAELIPYANNPRNNDKAVDAVAASIREFGFKIPIVVGSNGVIVAGHTRLKAAQKLGLESVPVIVADDLAEDQVKAVEYIGLDLLKADTDYERVKFLFNTILRERQLITYMKIKGCQTVGDNQVKA